MPSLDMYIHSMWGLQNRCLVGLQQTSICLTTLYLGCIFDELNVGEGKYSEEYLLLAFWVVYSQ